MADKNWMVNLQVLIRERGFTVKAVRTVTLPFVPFLGLTIAFDGLTFTIVGLDYDYKAGRFTAYSTYPHIKPEEFDRVIAIHRKNGFDTFDWGPQLAWG